MDPGISEVLKHLEEEYLPSARWWPWKGAKQRVELHYYEEFGRLLYLVLESRGLLFQLPLAVVPSIPSELSSRGFCTEEACFVEAEYLPDYPLLIQGLESLSVRVLGDFDLKGLRVLEARPLTLESTNSIVEYSTQLGSLVLKSYRLLPEVGFEAKMLERLAKRGYKHAPRVRALFYYRDRAAGILMDRVSGVADGGAPFYSALVERLSRGAAGDRVGLASKLGVVVAEMHIALNHPADDPFFGPEPVASSDVSAWSSRTTRMLESALRNIDEHASSLPRGEAEELEYWRGLVEKKALGVVEDALSLMEKNTELYKARIHQDLHLAQMVYTGDGVLDFVVTDFEGEPGRSGAERTAKEPLLRDLASMVRSFHYLSHAAIMSALNLPRHRASLLMLEKDPSLEWRLKHVLAMCYSYLARMLGTGLLAPNELRVARKPWLYLYPWIVERAVYELYYESLYRPSWISIPVVGLVEAGLYKSRLAG